MNRFIPREKMSKKERRKLDQTKRQTWSISPVSRSVKSKKVYDRKKARCWSDDGTGLYIAGQRLKAHRISVSRITCPVTSKIVSTPRYQFSAAFLLSFASLYAVS